MNLLSMKGWAVVAIALVSLVSCAACANLPTPKTVTAVDEVCLTETTREEAALCLIQAYAITVDELADARLRGDLSDTAIAVLDVAITQTGERVAVAAETWAAVITLTEHYERIKGVASEGDLIALSIEIQKATAKAITEWNYLEPQVLNVITLKEEYTL